MTAELGRQWNELKASTKASDKKKMEKYEEQAREDKERYESAMAEYTPPPSDEEEKAEEKEELERMIVANEKLNIPEGLTPGVPGTSEMQIVAPIPYPEPPTDGKPIHYPEPPAAKKKVTGYVLFCREERPKVLEQYPDAKGAEVSKFLADLWKFMDADEKNAWNAKATN